MNIPISNFDLDKTPKPMDLWKNEKNKFRHWIIIFGLGLFIILSMIIAEIVLNVIYQNDIFEIIKNNSKDLTNAQIHQQWLSNYIAFPSAIGAMLLLGLVLYVHTVIVSYQKKSFSHISNTSLAIIAIGGFICLLKMLWLFFFSYKIIFTSPGLILGFISELLYVIFYIFISRKISMIKREFAIAEYVIKYKEEISKFQVNNNPSNQMNPNIFRTNPFMKPNQMAGSNVNLEEMQNLEDEKKYFEKLSKMTIDKLKELAQKMSISGYENMEKQELIKTIIRVAKNDNLK